MHTFIQTIQVAVALDATPEQKQAGAAACRAILASLESSPGHALALPSPIGPRVTIDEVLELAIAKLRVLVGEDGTRPNTNGFRVPVVVRTVP